VGDVSIELKRRALGLGFDAVGIAPLEANPHADALDRWLEAGYAGTMTYLHRQAAKRKDPRLIMPEARAAVVTLTNYWHGSGRADPGSATRSPAARVAQYAWSTDYHRIIGPRLEQLAAAITELVPGSRSRTFVDAGPVPERDLAQRAGLGWIGKNTMLIDPAIGSFTFIGIVLTDALLEPDAPFQADRCGTCRACLDACPTAAFPDAHVLDARRCISYLTIERRGDFSGVEREQVGEWLFGCDICQDVCPWNVRFARATTDAAFTPRPETAYPDLAELLRIANTTFESRYGETAFERPGVEGMRRNAGAVLDNDRASS
jgi:epoxyqueuosine reductase